MPRLPRVSGPQTSAALRRLGFRDRHQVGSHLVMVHEDGRRAVVPQHAARKLRLGTLHRILREASVSREEFAKALCP